MTDDMAIIHRVFRREFTLAPGLVRETAEGDTKRVSTLETHLRRLLGLLGHHHEGEDVLLWPKLNERAPEHRQLFEDMDADHAGIHAAIDEVDAALTTWSASASRADAEVLATAVERLTPPLLAHLDREEAEVLPIVERTLSPAEWGELGERGMAALAPPDAMIVLAQMGEDCPEEQWNGFFVHLPPPVQDAYREHAVPAYAAYVASVRGSGRAS
ncbi:hemerythrin domain-containing protein [Jatrophihabitans sp. YIM 134969]